MSRKITFPHIYTLEASAGSGKTYALAKRYLYLLGLGRQDAPLNSILAITFTNKAAVEMKERILEFLKRIALDKIDDKQSDIVSAISADRASAREKAAEIMNELIRNYNFFRVQTIDSFINSILSACSFKLGLSANFKTEKNYKDYLAYSLDRLIDRAVSDKKIAKIFYDFLEQYLYLENRTSWFPKQEIFSVIGELFSKSNRYAIPFVRNDIDTTDIIALKNEILSSMRCLRDNLPECAMLAFAKSLDNFLLRHNDGFSIDSLPDFFKRDILPVKKGATPDKTSIELWDKIRKSIIGVCRLESTAALNCYIDIFNYALSELKDICSVEDVLFLESLNKQAAVLFDNLALPELYCRMATVFRHFLIDEFQDTSYLQWNNLFIMIEEALSVRGSLFYVGDQKQAIYRFRGGEVSLIDAVKRHFAGIRPIEQNLTKNYRSQKQIVEFNNALFSPQNIAIFLKSGVAGAEFECADTERIISIFADSKQTCSEDKTGGYIRLEFVNYRVKPERDILSKEKIIPLIKEIETRFGLNDIALLTRKNEDIELLTEWLSENGIPVASEKTLDVRRNPCIKEIISLLKFLNSPIDNLSFASFILGEIFLKAGGLNKEDIREFIFDFNNDKQNNGYLYTEFRNKFPCVWDGLIEEFFKNVGFIPFYELTVTIFAKFNISDNFSDYQGFFMKFLDLIKQKEEDKLSIAAFIEYFENMEDDQMYVHSAGADAVKILTIHKAKGLEFPVVIIPFLELSIQTDNKLVRENGNKLELMYLKKEYGAYCSDLAYEYKQQRLKSFIDELNSAYVALTRAINELYIFVPVKPERNLNLAKLLFSSLPSFDGNGLSAGEKETRFRKDAAAKKTIYLPASRYKDWIIRLKDEFSDKHIIENRKVVRRGEALHYALSFIVNTDKRNKYATIKQALEKARLRFPDPPDLDGAETLLNNLLNAERLREYFEISNGDVYLEKEIVDFYGNVKRIDRLIINKKEAVVIDYKNGKINREDHHQQVTMYMDLIRNIYPGLKVKGVLVYLDDLSCEEI